MESSLAKDGQLKMTRGSSTRHHLSAEEALDALESHSGATSVRVNKKDADGKAVGTNVPYTTLFKLQKKKAKIIKAFTFQYRVHSAMCFDLWIG
jgi:hypothetical protein